MANLLLDSLCQEKELKNDIMEKEYPLVSVIIPVYNAHNSITKTLQSVINQTYTNLEIVVVNDGSTDHTGEILEEYKKRYPEHTRVIHQENKGVSATRNAAMDQAKGKYIAFLDSDDYVDIDYLEVLYKAAEEHESDMVLSGQHKVDENGNTIANVSYPVDKYPDYVLRRLNLHGKLYRREFLNKHHLRFVEGKLYEDNPFNLVAMFLCKNQVILPYNGHYQVMHSGSLMTRQIVSDNIPYGEIERVIRYNLKHKDQINDESIFEFTVLSFLTFFLFQASRKHMYAVEKIAGRKSVMKHVKEESDYMQRIVQQYFPNCCKNKHVGIFKERNLDITQRAGVWLFTRLIKTHLLKPFTILFYKLF